MGDLASFGTSMFVPPRHEFHKSTRIAPRLRRQGPERVAKSAVFLLSAIGYTPVVPLCFVPAVSDHLSRRSTEETTTVAAEILMHANLPRQSVPTLSFCLREKR
jgi:hypothetical protein